jgi:hypothetical protein
MPDRWIPPSGDPVSDHPTIRHQPPMSTVVCRGKTCRRQISRPEAVAARKVLSDPKARGWFCVECAAYWRKWRRSQHAG